MSSVLRCPICNGEFEFENEPLEEIRNPTLTVVRKSKDRSSWSEIANNIINGRARMMFDVGDSIECKLKDGRKVIIDVADINPFGEDEVVFCFRDAYWEHSMNDRNTNRGGFCQSGMRAFLDGEVFGQLPDDLQEVIVPRRIVQDINGSTFECESLLWLPSINEVYGDKYNQYRTDVGDVQFEIFKSAKYRIKFDEAEDTRWWFLRSPRAANSTGFWLVNNGGNMYHGIAGNTYAVVPCFSIKARKTDDGEANE